MTTYKRYAHSNINNFVNMQSLGIDMLNNISQTKLPIFVTDDITHYYQNGSKRFRDKSAIHRHKKSRYNRSGKRYFDDHDYDD